MDHVRTYLVCLKCDCPLNMMITTHIFSQSVLEATKMVVLVCTHEKCQKCSPTQPASRLRRGLDCCFWVGKGTLCGTQSVHPGWYRKGD